MTDRRGDLLAATLVALIIGLMALTFFAHPAYGQEQRCTVQSFDPPIGPTFAMPGDADTIRITLADGGGLMLVGPFVLGDVVDAGGLVVGLEKCSGSLPEPTPEPEPTPTVPALDPTPVPEPSPMPVPEDQCCTTVVTPGPTATPTPIIPAPPTPEPTVPPFRPWVPTPQATPTPELPELPATGATTDLLVVLALLALAGGLMLATHRRWS
jgi:LPXTG-motif cell wall-anchored protein